MSTLIRPKSYFDDQRPVEFAPYFNGNTGEFKYWERLDTSRVEQDTFTYVSGAMYQGTKNIKLKLQLSIDVNAKPMPHIGNITTYASNDKSRAFRRQLKLVYGTGRRDEIPYYLWHKSKVDTLIKSTLLTNGVNESDITIQSGIPTGSSNKNNPLTSQLMKDSMVSIVSGLDFMFCVVSIGRFSKQYLFEQFDKSKAKDKKLKEGTNYPALIFHDYRDDLLDD